MTVLRNIVLALKWMGGVVQRNPLRILYGLGLFLILLILSSVFLHIPFNWS